MKEFCTFVPAYSPPLQGVLGERSKKEMNVSRPPGHKWKNVDPYVSTPIPLLGLLT